jgi:copper chaperone
MATVKIKGMSCNHCVMAVTKALNEIDGVEDVKADLAKGEATYNEAIPVDMDVVKAEIAKAGYEVGWSVQRLAVVWAMGLTATTRY